MDTNDHLRGAALLSPGPDSPQGATSGRATEGNDTSQMGSLISDATQGNLMMHPKLVDDSEDSCPAAATTVINSPENSDMIGVEDRMEAGGAAPSDRDDADEVGSKNEGHAETVDRSHLVTDISQHPHAECVKLMHYAMDAKKVVGDH